MTPAVSPALGNRPATIFLHANGFPTGCYRQFCERLAERVIVDSPPVLATPLHLPAGRRWGDMLEQVVRRIDAGRQAGRRRVSLVGNSMGGYLAITWRPCCARSGSAMSC
ncbi:MAG: alpha/beta hydrolase [Burkholderiaceae bacterium]